MKTLTSFIVGFCLLNFAARGQTPVQPASQPPAPTASSSSATSATTTTVAPASEPSAALRSPEQLEQLLGPIALYPDALIALILPASTAASDVVLASRYLKASGDPAQIDSQPWEESVKSLSRYPEVVNWMDENLEWTKQLGDAFDGQPADVMNAIQRLRVRAKAAGTLVDTPQQQVVAQDDAISIVPAEPDVIYVPRYDPEIVYVERPYYGVPFLTFGAGLAIGPWLDFECDWGQRRIWIDRRFRDGPVRRNWRNPPTFPVGPNFAHDPRVRPWQPPPNRLRPHFADPHLPRRDIVRPMPLPGTPIRPGNGRRDDHRQPPTGPGPTHSAPDGRNRDYRRPNTQTPSPRSVNPNATSGAASPALIAPSATTTPRAAAGSPVLPLTGNPANPPHREPSQRATHWNNRANPGGVRPSFRAGSLERPRSAPAPGIPLNRTPAPARTAPSAPATPAGNPASQPSQGASAPAPSGSESRAGTRGGGMQSRQR